MNHGLHAFRFLVQWETMNQLGSGLTPLRMCLLQGQEIPLLPGPVYPVLLPGAETLHAARKEFDK